jgi:hypothetical protein
MVTAVKTSNYTGRFVLIKEHQMCRYTRITQPRLCKRVWKWGRRHVTPPGEFAQRTMCVDLAHGNVRLRSELLCDEGCRM